MSTISAARPLSRYRSRLSGEKRAELRADIAQAYRDGASIRAVALAGDLSYGTARKMLLEADVKLRGRGGARSAARAATVAGQ
ncbi:helix-turn-helix domain-containing protein [Streptomyces sp. H27-H5]|uniref:helix-turn-helix domain-containing protein n=1 Tax=Streptomyces sp. H27-H5 TaxID=2996460 RepID=UPI0022718D38|nr:helix-turn-helix domain-containing protein [Streptomyces sp. H27-H5]MCY0957664.1 helix-turn-helix domain-containing protein [Streptomyces sp. H27-H5]